MTSFKEQHFNIVLDNDRAIILLNFLINLNNDIEKYKNIDEAEKIVLWDLEAFLEKNITEIFDADFEMKLERIKYKLTKNRK